MAKKIFSFDAETNGLWGQAFSIAAVVTEDNKVVKEFTARCPLNNPDPWVAENVLPEMEGIPVTHESYNAMLEAFIRFYMENKEDVIVLVHMGLPVESKIFLDAHAFGILGDWDAPYPLVDISAIPEIGVSVDTYNKNNRIILPEMEGGTHNPMYDSLAAAYAYDHWCANR